MIVEMFRSLSFYIPAFPVPFRLEPPNRINTNCTMHRFGKWKNLWAFLAADGLREVVTEDEEKEREEEEEEREEGERNEEKKKEGSMGEGGNVGFFMDAC